MSYTLLYYIKDIFFSLFVRKCVIYNQKNLEIRQKYRTFASKKQNKRHEKNQNATLGKNHPYHSAGRNLRQFLQ